MKKLLHVLLLTGILSALAVTVAFAGPPDKGDGFVCPVLGGQAGEEHGNSDPTRITNLGITGDYTIPGPDVYVPTHATNDEGAGIPGGDHASPGDVGYTAIWNK
ncbi:MAG: hypothetical protein ACK2U3_08055 [Anaerolineales bacterium]